MKHKSTDTPGIVAPPPLIYGASLLLGIILDIIFPTPIGKETFLFPIGWILSGMGLFIVIGSFITFKKAGTDVDPYRPTKTIVTVGPYRFTRNPIYLSLTLLYMGITLLRNTLWPVLFLPLVLGIMHYGVIKREELYLEKKFGETYLDYKSKVRRWI
ncbi:MAG: isoprenylcysteine carboxylmethyltransferase family protein [Candidatus Marinimicrobia bacterium]|nr:isoprenylcysteine carboxylmethyltransferase family protein [Candidatus Neomarinimicrobiota bacterium]